MASLTFDWIQLAAILGAVQGFLLAFVLLAQRDNRTANRLLAFLMISFGLYLASAPYYSAGIVRQFPHFFPASYLMPWTFGALVYLYARAASDRSWRFDRHALLHFLPVTIVFLLALPLFLTTGAEKIATFDHWASQGLTQPLRSIDPFKYSLGLGYSAMTVLYLHRHRRIVEHSYSNLERVNLRWLLMLTLATGAIWLLATGLRISPMSARLRDPHITFAMAILVYGIGYFGLRQPEIFRHAVTTEGEHAAHPSNEPTAQYQRSGLEEEDAKQLMASLHAVMDTQQPWKDSELTLAELAARLGSTPQRLSEVLNGRIGQTFYDFVNGYRVREVQRRIVAGDARSLKILALASDAGFRSKSTFNEAFKRVTSQTPSGFRQTVGA